MSAPAGFIAPRRSLTHRGSTRCEATHVLLDVLAGQYRNRVEASALVPEVHGSGRRIDSARGFRRFVKSLDVCRRSRSSRRNACSNAVEEVTFLLDRRGSGESVEPSICFCLSLGVAAAIQVTVPAGIIIRRVELVSSLSTSWRQTGDSLSGIRPHQHGAPAG